MPLNVTRYYFIPAGTTYYDYSISGSVTLPSSADVEARFLDTYAGFNNLQDLFEDDSSAVVRYDDGLGYTYWQITSEVVGVTTINQGTTPIQVVRKGTDLVWARYYTITWKNYAGTVIKTDYMPYGTSSTPPSGTADTSQWDYSWPVSSHTVTGDATIQETRTVKTYTVVWKNYAGTTVRTDSNQPYGTVLTAPTGTADTVQYDYFWLSGSAHTVTGNVTIEEDRSLQTYTVTWKNYAGGTRRTDSNIAYGTVLYPPAGTADTEEWDYYWPSNSHTVTGDETITELRSVQTYTIIWKNYAGTVLKTDSNIPYYTIVTAPTGTADTAEWDYSWPYGSIRVTEDRTIQETRLIKKYSVYWNNYAGTTLRVDVNKNYGTSLTAPTGTTDDAQWDYYWPSNPYIVIENETITELRSVKSYTVTWKNYAGTTLRTDSNKPYGTVLYPPAGTSDTAQYDYYWSVSSHTVTGNATITELRVTKTYTVTWKNYAGTTLRTDSNKPYGTVLYPPAGTSDTAQYDYYWSVSSHTVTEEKTIIERRVLQDYQVTWKDWDNTTLKTETVSYGRSGTPPADPTRSGYVFTGWSGDYTGITGNVTITAQYTTVGGKWWHYTTVEYNEYPYPSYLEDGLTLPTNWDYFDPLSYLESDTPASTVAIGTIFGVLVTHGPMDNYWVIFEVRDTEY